MTRVYVASNLPTAYPFKLQKPSTINESVRETAQSFIMDSGIGDDVSNAEVLDLAHDYDADFVIAKDYLHDQARTTDSVRDFFGLYNAHPCEATPMVPLQPPFDEHYLELEGYDYYVLGGMAVDDVTTDQRLKWIRDFRNVAGSVYAHGLGVGGGIGFVTECIKQDIHLDSVDCSTPELAAKNGCVVDDELRQRELRVYSGEGARRRNVPLAAFNSWQVADVWRRELADNGQTSMDRFL